MKKTRHQSRYWHTLAYIGNPHKNVVLCSCRCSDKSGSLSMAPLYEKAEGNFQFGPLIKQRKFPDSTHEEGGNTTKAGAGNFCHSNSRIKHISGQWIFCYASAYAIQLLYDKFAEKNHDFLDSCWHVVFRKNALWDFLLKRCWQQQHLFYTLTPSTWAFPSFYRPTAYQVLTEDVTPADAASHSSSCAHSSYSGLFLVLRAARSLQRSQL